MPGSARIPARADRVVARPRQTVLAAAITPGGSGPVPAVQTVEHLLSAMTGVGITDALVLVSGPEVPLGDGSAAPFVDALLGAGIVPAERDPGVTHAPLIPIIVQQAIELVEGDARITALPTEGPYLDMTYDLDYGAGAPMPPQSAYYRHDYTSTDPAGYRRDIAPARTFCTETEAAQLRAAGLFAHLKAGDVVVLGAEGPIGGTLRFSNEPARHKLLDVLGDLSLAGRPIFGRINAARSGHALNHRMAMVLGSL